MTLCKPVTKVLLSLVVSLVSCTCIVFILLQVCVCKMAKSNMCSRQGIPSVSSL